MFLSNPELAEAKRSHAFFGRLVERVAALPGVESAAGVLLRPLEGSQGFDYPFTIEGRPPDEQKTYPFLNYEAITPGYFASTGLRLRQGRAFTADDRADAPRVVILGESVARRFWGSESPVGARIKWGGPDGPGPWSRWSAWWRTDATASSRARASMPTSRTSRVPGPSTTS